MLFTYDPKLVLVTFAGIPLTGFMDGTFLTVERAEDMFTEISGAGGEVTRAKTNNRMGSATLTLQQSSPSNDLLSGFAVADETANAGVKVFAVKDALGTTALMSAFAYVKKLPNSEFAKEVSGREWVLTLTDMAYFVGGNFPQV